ncbi:MAG: energy-coupled thiamine transporter ThiT [Clostridia bacterium]|nr:energy-coupled thiamine transporter ThiT [Clostridia bacterium]
MTVTKETKKLNVYALCQCGIFVALATILSFLPVYEMPMGGSVTLASMLPILFIGVKFGYKWGMGASTVYMFIQLLQALIKGNVFIYCVGAGAVIVCVLFDYVVPFAILGLSAFAKPKENGKINIVKVCVTFGVLIFIRFLCHFITGIVIWGQWAPEGMGKFIYSLAYNGQYMLPELIITVVVAALLLSSKQIEKLLAEK